MDQAKHQAMEALQHIERNRPLNREAKLGSPQLKAPMADSASILQYIQDLERKVALLQSDAQNDTSSQNVSRPGSADEDAIGPKTRESRLDRSQSRAGWIVDIKRFKKLNYRYGSAELYDDSENIEAIRARESSARGGGYVLNVYREYDWEGNALNSKLEICSTPLLEHIRSLIDYYPGSEYDLLRWEDTVGDNVTFTEPYMMLFTHRSELNDSLSRDDLPQQTKAHIELLLRFLREEMPRTSQKLDEIEAGTCRRISFQDLWLLYTPNTPVYTIADGEERQLMVYSRNNPEKNVKGQFGVLSLYCWSSVYQSKTLGRDFYPQVIQPFTGDKLLTQLELVPMQYLGEKRKDVEARLAARGHRYYELHKSAVLQDYTGNRFPRVFKDVSHIRRPLNASADHAQGTNPCGCGPRDLLAQSWR